MRSQSHAAAETLARTAPGHVIWPPIHPDRTRYQLLEPLPPPQYAALKADIKAHGVLVPIEVDEDGHILDGHHREAIARELNVGCPRVTHRTLSEAEKRRHVLTVNLLRRHLDSAAWGKAFARLLAERGVRIGRGRQKARTDTVSVLAAELGVNERTARRRLKQASVQRRTLSAAKPTRSRPPRTRPTKAWQAPLTQALRAALAVATIEHILAHVRGVLDA